MPTVVLFRPTGPKELELVAQSGYRAWPPRLPEQPIFYPVTNEQYAIEIARDWNVKSDGSGFVTRFHVDADFMNKYQIQKVGGAHHTEWWVPAEDLEELNQNIVGTIEVIHEYRAHYGNRAPRYAVNMATLPAAKVLPNPSFNRKQWGMPPLGLHFILPQTSSYPTAPVNSHYKGFPICQAKSCLGVIAQRLLQGIAMMG